MGSTGPDQLRQDTPRATAPGLRPPGGTASRFGARRRRRSPARRLHDCFRLFCRQGVSAVGSGGAHVPDGEGLSGK